MNKPKIVRKNIKQLLISIAIIILINILGFYVFTRIDLTTEKRYTLSDATKKVLKNLDDIVYFKVYLEGEFPSGFKRLRNETKEMLNEFKSYSNNIQYEFINPNKEGNDKKTLREIYKQLYMKGLEPTNLQVKDNGQSSQQIIFPGAIVTYKEKEIPMQLLMSQFGSNSENVVNNSIQSLEYNIINAIKKLTVDKKPKVGIISGHGELKDIEIADFTFALSEYYNVEKVIINGRVKSLDVYKAIVIAKPDSLFDEKDKYIIDQFVMKGGRVMWLIDPIFASMDSLRKNNETVGIGRQLNLEDMLFKYGVRLNYNLILDMQALPIPVVTGKVGKQVQQALMPWYFFPLLNPLVKHPIVNNLNAIKTEFVSTLDTVVANNVKKTILLTSSKNCRVANSPVSINLEILKKEPDIRLFNKAYLPVAVLLEGKFESVFKNRLTDELVNNKEIGYKESGLENKMIIISDGDIAKNQVRLDQNQQLMPLPLGYDRYTNQTFGNKDFLMNSMNYLCDESGLIYTRSREVKLRILDRTYISEAKFEIQIINTVIPIILILVFYFIYNFIRKRKNK